MARAAAERWPPSTACECRARTEEGGALQHAAAAERLRAPESVGHQLVHGCLPSAASVGTTLSRWCHRAHAAPSAEVGAQDRDERHHLAGVAAEVVGERERRGRCAIRRSSGASPRSCSQHSNIIRRPDAPTGCPKLFSPPSGLTGSSPSRSKVPGEDLLPGRAPLGEAEVFHQDQLGGGEAVVHLGHGELVAGIGDAGLRVGVADARLDLGEVRVVVVGSVSPEPLPATNDSAFT